MIQPVFPWRGWGCGCAVPLHQLYRGHFLTWARAEGMKRGGEYPPAITNGVEQFTIPVDQWELFAQLFSLPRSPTAHFITLPLAAAAPTALPLRKKPVGKIARRVFCAECRNNVYPIALRLVYVLPCVSVTCSWPLEAHHTSGGSREVPLRWALSAELRAGPWRWLC